MFKTEPEDLLYQKTLDLKPLTKKEQKAMQQPKSKIEKQHKSKISPISINPKKHG